MSKVFSYKGDRYVILHVAVSLNGGEYYVCWKIDEYTQLYLIPCDSDDIMP